MLNLTSKIVKKILENKHFSVFGQKTMAIYLIHVATYRIVGRFILETAGISGPYVVQFLIAMTVSWIAILALSYPTTWIIDKSYKYLCIPIDRVTNKIEKMEF